MNAADQTTEAHAAATLAAGRSKDAFFAMLAHELRNSLAPIRAALELMRLRGVSSREHDIIERQVVSCPALPHRHLIAVTGYGEAADVQRSRTAEFAGHLVKPVSLRQLLQLFKELGA